MSRESKQVDVAKPFSKAKSAVVRAASRAVREDGPRAATLKNVAGRAGITEPAIFRHFDGVDGLFEGLFQTVEAVADRFEASFDPSLPPIHRLGKALKTRIESFAADVDLACLYVYRRQIFQAYPGLRDRMDAREKTEVDFIADCLGEARKAGAFRSEMSAFTLRAFTSGAARSLTESWIAEAGGFDLSAAFDSLWSDFIKLAAPHSAPRKKPAKP